MNPKSFLQIGGTILVVLGLYGFVDADVKGSSLYFDSAENWAHLIVGVVALLAAYRLGESAQRSLVLLVGIVSLVFAVWGYMVRGNPEPNLGMTNLEHPLDNLLHLVVGVWGLLAARGKPKMAMGM